MKAKVRKRLTKAEALRRAYDQLKLFTRPRDSEGRRAKEAAEDAIAFLTTSERKVFTVNEVELMLDW